MIQSPVIDLSQTTIPKAVREPLDLRREEAGPALLGFLDLLQRDIAARPDRLRPVSERLVDRGRDLVRGVEIDIDSLH